jgi:hypothetical protein
VSTVDPAHLRDKSQVAFGQRYRLELMLAVAASDDGIVCLTDLARQLDVSISNLQIPPAELLQLDQLGRLLRALHRGRRLYGITG